VVDFQGLSRVPRMSDASIARVNEPFIVAKGTVRKQFLATTQGQAACAGNYGKGRDRDSDCADLETNRFVWVSMKDEIFVSTRQLLQCLHYDDV
jgi:hypothetical protein